MAKILDQLSLFINAVIFKFWKNYSDREIADAVNKFVLKGKNKITVTAIRHRRQEQGLTRVDHIKVRKNKPALVIDVDTLKIVNETPTKESDRKIIQEIVDS